MSIELIIILSVVGLIFVVSLVSTAIKAWAERLSLHYSFKKLSINRPMVDYARLLLDENGLEDVAVEKVGFFKSLFVGNTYKKSTRTIRLSWQTAKKSNLTCLATVCSLVGIAKMDTDGIKGAKAISVNRHISWLPALFVPLIVIGLVLDLVISTEAYWLYTIIFSCVGFGLTLFAFIFSLIAHKAINKSYDLGEKMLLDMQIVDPSEEKVVKRIYKAWKAYNFIKVFQIAFEVIYFVLRILLLLFKPFGRK